MTETMTTGSAGDRVLAGRYELGELIGIGAMAEVYRARDRLLERTVAVKLFRATADPAAHRRFDDEAHALARLTHPGLVLIYDVGTVADRPFLVMELVEGASLAARLREGPLPVPQVARIGAVLADALAHAHSRGVVHRDVKPSNIMLDQEASPHLTDFGIALLAGAPRRTSVHDIIGTPAYLAPEQLSDVEIGPRADVYALALVLLECLSGEVEYSGDSNLQVAMSRLSRPPRIPGDLPPALAAVLTAMTSTDPDARPTAAYCAQELLAAAGDPEPVTAPTVWWADANRTTRLAAATPRTPSRARAIRKHWSTLAASAAGIAAVAVALVLLLNTGQPPTSLPQSGGTGQAQGSPGTGTSTGPAGNAPTHRSHPTAGTLVANRNPVLVVNPPASAPTGAPTTSSTPPPATSTTPPATTTSSPPPTTSPTDPSTTTSDPVPAPPTNPSNAPETQPTT